KVNCTRKRSGATGVVLARGASATCAGASPIVTPRSSDAHVSAGTSGRWSRGRGGEAHDIAIAHVREQVVGHVFARNLLLADGGLPERGILGTRIRARGLSWLASPARRLHQLLMQGAHRLRTGGARDHERDAQLRGALG